MSCYLFKGRECKDLVSSQPVHGTLPKVEGDFNNANFVLGSKYRLR
jgi:hypothetical protein